MIEGSDDGAETNYYSEGHHWRSGCDPLASVCSTSQPKSSLRASHETLDRCYRVNSSRVRGSSVQAPKHELPTSLPRSQPSRSAPFWRRSVTTTRSPSSSTSRPTSSLPQRSRSSATATTRTCTTFLGGLGMPSYYGGSTQVHLAAGPRVDAAHLISLRAALISHR